MALSGSLPQINLGVQGETQGGLHTNRHHLIDYDRGRAVGRLEAGQNVTTVAAAMDVPRVPSRNLGRPLKVEMLCESMPGACSRAQNRLERGVGQYSPRTPR
ncbi:hypothetical protein TNCV_4581691 [Trichonephila clavipes]|nr:hypothetical protein TNCV_4581691 [Trichonephila clavipes]